MAHYSPLIRALVCGLFWSVASTPGLADPETSAGRVQLLYEADNPVHAGVISGLQEAASGQHPFPELNITSCRVREAVETSCTPDDLSPNDLLISVGARVFRQLVNAQHDNPGIAALIPRVTYEEMIGEKREDVGAVLVEQDPARLLRLAITVLPEASSFGIVVSQAPDVMTSRLATGSLASPPAIHTELVEEEGETAIAFERMLDRSEAVIALPDPLLLDRNNTKWLLYMAANAKTPVFGYSRAYVKAGALAAIYSTPQQVGRQLADEILRWSRRGPAHAVRVVYASEFEVETNSRVARRLGVSLPSYETLLKRIDNDVDAPEERR